MLSYLARRSLSTATRAPAYAKATGELRESFLGYFEKQGHTRVASSGLVPGDDPTILFTNAGMNQFKDQMAGLVEPTHARATSAQKCVRAGGKHNDLDNVGFTNRHHTFFEMMGNFSLGAYSREEAIVYAWRFLTEELGLPRDQLGVTVHHSDSESLALWEKVAGLSLSSAPGRMRLLGDEDNFWAMGPTGPCGVCSEIFWDQGSHIVDPEERWLEVWNLVFMDSLRDADGSLTPLARPCIDTGMGLERMASVLQGVPSNYEIDSMAVLMNSARDLVTTRTTPGGTNAVLHAKGGNDFRVLTPAVVALRVMTDHVRAAAFLISEGVFPSNVGRGYVVRRIIRRAVRYAASLGMQGSCLAALLPTLRATMGDAYPQLVTGGDTGIDISAVLTGEEDLFHRTLDRGLKHLHSSCSGRGAGVSADLTFMLWDSYGFPLDITTAIAKEEGWTVDEKGFHELMAVQKERSRAATTFAASDTTQRVPPEVYEWSSNLFTGYEMTKHAARIQARAEVGKNEAWIQLDRCPFYAESGGQASDQGYLMVAGRRHAVQEVMRTPAGAVVLRVSDRHGLATVHLKVEAVVDAEARARTAAHHTATHLVHAALKAILPAPQGQVAQAGSSVDAERLRFDFTFQGKLTPELVAEVEAWVNKYCAEKLAVSTSVKSLQEARAGGATALFGEKYGEEVRVVEIGDISQELCGGTHVASLREVLPFKILSTESVASGTKRIEAVAGEKAIEVLLEHSSALGRIATLLKAPKSGVEEAMEKLNARYNDLKKEHSTLKKQVGVANKAKAAAPSALDFPKTLHQLEGMSLVLHTLPEGPAPATLRAAGGAACAADKSIHVFLQPTSGLVLIVADARVHGELGGAKGVFQCIQEETGGFMDSSSSAKFATGTLARPQDLAEMLADSPVA